MNTIENGIDQSVNLLTGNTLVKNWKNYIPLFPISRAEQLKSALLKRFRAEYEGMNPRLIVQAINEAHALASVSGEPLLLLPVLAEEKVQRAAAWSERQRSVPWLNPLALEA
jgi:hypothetical protein